MAGICFSTGVGGQKELIRPGMRSDSHLRCCPCMKNVEFAASVFPEKISTTLHAVHGQSFGGSMVGPGSA